VIHTQSLVDEIEKVILGKSVQVKLALTCLLADGHLLVEDLPGMGKTTLAHALANVLGLNYKRIQFTADLLPSDVVGSSIYDIKNQAFTFQPGPVFTEVLLADELNRATPKAQSALLEAMEERQVSVDGSSKKLPSEFFVIATQNPQSQSGTFPLPESQLDRFLFRLSLGYPNKTAEMKLLQGLSGRQQLTDIKTLCSTDELQQLKLQVRQVNCSNELLDYVYRLLECSRLPELTHVGLSIRAGLGLVHAAKAWAFLHQQDYVLPEDVQAVFPSLAAHRLKSSEQVTDNILCDQILTRVAVIS